VNAVGEQEVFMYSGLEQEQAALRRERSVAWAWIKARGIMKSRANSTHAKLTASVLLTSDCSQVEEISSWRDSLAAFNHRSLARQICEQFYDLSILSERRGPAADAFAAEPPAGSVWPSHCAEEAKAQLMRDDDGGRRELGIRKKIKARILSAVLPGKGEQRGVLISMKSRAA
jgi:hypothetical protein